MDLLPHDMIITIFDQLTIPELLNCCQTCKRLNTYRKLFESKINSHFDNKFENARQSYYLGILTLTNTLSGPMMAGTTFFERPGVIDPVLISCMNLSSNLGNMMILRYWWYIYLIRYRLADHRIIFYDTIFDTDDFMSCIFGPQLPKLMTWFSFEQGFLLKKIDYNTPYPIPMQTLGLIYEEERELMRIYSRDGIIIT